MVLDINMPPPPSPFQTKMTGLDICTCQQVPVSCSYMLRRNWVSHWDVKQSWRELSICKSSKALVQYVEHIRLIVSENSAYMERQWRRGVLQIPAGLIRNGFSMSGDNRGPSECNGSGNQARSEYWSKHCPSKCVSIKRYTRFGSISIIPPVSI